MTSPKDPPEGIKNMRNYLGLPPTDPKDPQAEAFKQVNEALNNAKVPTEDRQVMDADDPRVFNPLAAQTDIGEVISGILENFRVRTLEKQDKGNKRDTTKALLALFQAHQQELLNELLGELPKHRLNNQPDYTDFPAQYSQGFNEAVNQVVSVIERLQNKTNDGGSDGASE